MKKPTIALLFFLAVVGTALIYRPVREEKEAPSFQAQLLSRNSTGDVRPGEKLQPGAPLVVSGPAARLDEVYDKKPYPPVLFSAAPAGADPSQAYVRVPSTASRLLLTPNQPGEFPTLPAGLLETVAARVDLPDCLPGTSVAVTILDGGTFPGGGESEASRLLKVEDWGGVEFRYTTPTATTKPTPTPPEISATSPARRMSRDAPPTTPAVTRASSSPPLTPVDAASPTRGTFITGPTPSTKTGAPPPTLTILHAASPAPTTRMPPAKRGLITPAANLSPTASATGSVNRGPTMPPA